MRHPAITRLLLPIAAAALALSACGDSSETAAAEFESAAGGNEIAEGTVDVAIVNFVFEPRSTTVRAGSTVRWTNEDAAAHTVRDTSDLDAGESADLGEGDTFEITYDEPGTYTYICGIHQYMTGTVVVEG